MNKYLKLLSSVIMIALGVWLLLPTLPIVKPMSSVLGVDIIWYPYLVDLLKGVIPVAMFLFGCLLLWIELDNFRHRNLEDNLEAKDFSEDDMPEFEDVEYKDLNCPECGEDFKTDIGLKVHRKVNHPEKYKKNPEPSQKEN